MALTDATIADLLHRWALWCSAGNRAGLGYAMVGYAERIASSWSTDNTPPPVDPDVLRIDGCVRRLPAEHRAVFCVHYLQSGTARAKHARLELSRDRYYELLDHGRAFVCQMMRENPIDNCRDTM